MTEVVKPIYWVDFGVSDGRRMQKGCLGRVRGKRRLSLPQDPAREPERAGRSNDPRCRMARRLLEVDLFCPRAIVSSCQRVFIRAYQALHFPGQESRLRSFKLFAITRRSCRRLFLHTFFGKSRRSWTLICAGSQSVTWFVERAER